MYFVNAVCSVVLSHKHGSGVFYVFDEGERIFLSSDLGKIDSLRFITEPKFEAVKRDRLS